MTPFARALVRKSERALKTARLALSSGDFDNAVSEPVSLEEIRRQARENWLRLRQRKIEGVERADIGHGTDREVSNDQSDSIDDYLDE
jgi:hypothetical protein